MRIHQRQHTRPPTRSGFRHCFRHCAALFLALAFVSQTVAVTLPNVVPAKVGMSAERLAYIDAAVAEAIEKKELPGAVVLAARRGGVVWRKAYGARSLMPSREEMTTDTIFDVASLTKVVATATSAMILVERGRLRLSDPLSRYITELKGEGREKITVEQLLTHRSGYAPDFDLREQWTGHEEMLKRLYVEPLRSAPGSRFVYSDIGMIALGEVIRRVSGQPLDEFARRNIFEPLGMRDTGFRPRAELLPRVAPTESVRGMRSYLGGTGEASAEGERMLRGEVHDPTSNRMGGVAGHAGLFSTADDLAVFCQMILGGGEYKGVRILSPLGVEEMTRPRQVTEEGGARGLGWDINTSFSANRGELFPVGSFGHTGFTGTSVWVDPATESLVVFLSNRVHPDGKGDVSSVRARVATITAGAVTDLGSVLKSRLEQQDYVREMVAGFVRFQVSLNEARAGDAERAPAPSDAEVLNGVDVLQRDGFKQLAGMRVGLITNHTGRDRRGRQTIDVLREAPRVRLVTLFSPRSTVSAARSTRRSPTQWTRRPVCPSIRSTASRADRAPST